MTELLYGFVQYLAVIAGLACFAYFIFVRPFKRTSPLKTYFVVMAMLVLNSVFHELGHVLVGTYLGLEFTGFSFSGPNTMVSFNLGFSQMSHEVGLLLVLAGPLAELLYAFVLALISKFATAKARPVMVGMAIFQGNNFILGIYPMGANDSTKAIFSIVRMLGYSVEPEELVALLSSYALCTFIPTLILVLVFSFYALSYFYPPNKAIADL